MTISLKLQGIARLPLSEINSGGRETPTCKISKLLQMLQNVVRCCKVGYLPQMKPENRETGTIELGVVDYPQNGEKVIFRNFMQCCRHPRFLQLLQNPVTYTLYTLIRIAPLLFTATSMAESLTVCSDLFIDKKKKKKRERGASSDEEGKSKKKKKKDRKEKKSKKNRTS